MADEEAAQDARRPVNDVRIKRTRLDPMATETELFDLLRPCPDGRLAFHPVDTRVGNVKNDDAGLVEPVAGLFPA